MHGSEGGEGASPFPTPIIHIILVKSCNFMFIADISSIEFLSSQKFTAALSEMSICSYSS